MALSGTSSTAKSKIYFALALGCAAALGIASAEAQQPARAGVYTAAQADAGRAVYQANCAACHLPDLKGSNEALPLAGGNFMSAWRNRTTSDLFSKILTSMPPGKTGSLGETEIVTIVAFHSPVERRPGWKSGAQRHLRCAYRGRSHRTSRRAASFR